MIFPFDEHVHCRLFFYGYLSVFGVIHLKLETFVYLEWRIQDM